jgi:hypothetical protein
VRTLGEPGSRGADPYDRQVDIPALHLTNGDAAVFDIARAAGVPPETVVPWRDALHDGPVPAGLATDALARVRAGHVAARGWAGEAEALLAFLERDARLAAHPADAEVVLWFEDDLYDALQLAQIGDRLAGRPGAVLRVVMPHDRTGGLADAYASRSEAVPDGGAFADLRAGDPRGWAEHRFMDRLLEELPDTVTGLSRLEREILDVLTAGPLDGAELFMRVAALEQPPWLGDATVWAVAAALDPLVARDHDGAWRITAAGEAVLAGHARRAADDHWVGGVHLVPGEPAWAWDARAGEAVLR